MSRKSKRSNGRVDTSTIDAQLAQGGLAVYERDDLGTDIQLFHLVPEELANSLRFFISRMHTSDWEGDSHTLAVTSALAGEGVTSVARSLAAILAHDLERSVCLVETNWWDAPDAAPADAILGSGRRPGLGGVLNGACSIDDTLLRTSDDRLVVLTAGDLSMGRRSAAVSGGAFHDVVETLAKDFDTVVIDVPPVLRISESAVIAREAAATVLVVRRGVTTEQQVQTAVDELEGSHVLGVIVNRSPAKAPRLFRRLGLPL